MLKRFKIWFHHFQSYLYHGLNAFISLFSLQTRQPPWNCDEQRKIQASVEGNRSSTVPVPWTSACVERGFSINKDIPTTHLKLKTLIAKRMIYVHLNDVGGPLNS